MDQDNLVTHNSQGQLIASTPEDLQAFWDWFGDSAAVDEAGRPLVLYHGTGNLEGIVANGFDPALTGQGNDQYGSGFYFTSHKDRASGYCEAQLTGHDGAPLEKLGGFHAPGVLPVYLRIARPIRVDGDGESLKDADILLILDAAPGLYSADDSPLWNFEDLNDMPVRDGQFDKAALQPLLRRVSSEYAGRPLFYLEGDFYRDDSTAFREVCMAVLSLDGVAKTMRPWREGPVEQHWIAWMPDQIAPALGVWQKELMSEAESQEQADRSRPARDGQNV